MSTYTLSSDGIPLSDVLVAVHATSLSSFGHDLVVFVSDADAVRIAKSLSTCTEYRYILAPIYGRMITFEKGEFRPPKVELPLEERDEWEQMGVKFPE